jgi:putative PIN family toxin of toxin-antitoxin system
VIVVLDANILASMALARSGGVLATILEAWLHGQFIVVVSDHVLAELRRTLVNPYFSSRLPPHDVATYLAFVQTAARHVSISVQVPGVATHPEDDLVLATALSAGAQYLVTGDRRFLARVQQYQGVHLVRPADFVSILGPAT